MTDHDSVDTRLRRVERFLDSEARGWRDEDNWGRRRSREASADDKPSDLQVDEEKTKKDREALGFSDQSVLREGQVVHQNTGFTGTGMGQTQNPGVDDGRDAELRRNFRAGKGAVNDETAAQNDRADLLAQLDAFRGKPGVPELTGQESNDDLRQILLQAKKDNRPGNAANEVALEAARGNEATEKALETSQDPSRQARAEAQQDQKAAVDLGGAEARMPMAPSSVR